MPTVRPSAADRAAPTALLLVPALVVPMSLGVLVGEADAAAGESVHAIATYASAAGVPTDFSFAQRGFAVAYRFAAIPASTR